MGVPMFPHKWLEQASSARQSVWSGLNVIVSIWLGPVGKTAFADNCVTLVQSFLEENHKQIKFCTLV